MLPVLIICAPVVFCAALLAISIAVAAGKPTPPPPSRRSMGDELDRIDFEWVVGQGWRN